MKKYIDADKLRTLLDEKWRELADKNVKIGGGKWDAEISTYLSVLTLIDSLQQEQSEVVWEKQLDEWLKYGPHTSYPWCTIPDVIKITAEHFYELGLNARNK